LETLDTVCTLRRADLCLSVILQRTNLEAPYAPVRLRVDPLEVSSTSVRVTSVFTYDGTRVRIRTSLIIRHLGRLSRLRGQDGVHELAT
jgi:hypothetical protein